MEIIYYTKRRKNLMLGDQMCEIYIYTFLDVLHSCKLLSKHSVAALFVLCTSTLVISKMVQCSIV